MRPALNFSLSWPNSRSVGNELEMDQECRRGVYTLEFKQGSVSQVKADQLAVMVAKTLGMPRPRRTIRVCADVREEPGTSAGGRRAPAITPEQLEIARLRAELARLKAERDIATQAALAAITAARTPGYAQ